MTVKKKYTLVFDEGVGEDYKKPIDDTKVWRVILTARKRKKRGRKFFHDPEIYGMMGYKHPVVTRDLQMIGGDKNKPYKQAGKIVLWQTQKGTEKEQYKLRIKNFFKNKSEKDFKGKIVSLPITNEVVIEEWDDFVSNWNAKRARRYGRG